jgi:ribosomal-protein-alanine N-acetyltransferase
MIIETPRLHLREFVEGDWPAVLAYQSDPRYLRFYAWTERTEADVRAFVGSFVSWQAVEPRIKFQLAVTLRDGGRLIGNCGIRLAEAGSRSGDLGYEISPEFGGRGYATEAARAMVSFGFEELGLHRVWGECVPENSASRRVMEKLGMSHEGRLRQTQRYKGRWWDTLVYGMLEDEWRMDRGERLVTPHKNSSPNKRLQAETST